MAEQEQVERLARSVDEWNEWRQQRSANFRPDLSRAALQGAYLRGADLSGADLRGVALQGADLSRAALQGADLSGADLRGADLGGANLGLTTSFIEASDIDNLRPGDYIGTPIRVNLIGADLREANLIGANLREANLREANLTRAFFSSADLNSANLSRADLTGAVLSAAVLSGANLSGANLNKAYLVGAHLNGAHLNEAVLSATELGLTDFSDADLSNADLSNAHLTRADLSRANFSGTNFSEARLGDTIFARNDLSIVKGLETAVHQGPSIVDVKTVVFPQGEVCISFLRGVGFTETQIEYLPSLLMPRPIQYRSLFISYAHQDEILAQRLHANLREKDVPCWFALHDLQPGNYFREGIDQAIHTQDKVLLLLSEHSIKSGWVRYEVELALARENRQQREVLFPIRLDDAIFQCTAGWATSLQETRHIGNFTSWQNDGAYRQAFTTLLRHLKVTTPPTR